MANEIEFYSIDTSYTGAQLVARLLSLGVQVGADIALSEVSNSGNFIGSIPESFDEGTYLVKIFNDSENLISIGEISWDGEKEVVIDSSELNSISYTITNSVRNILYQEQPTIHLIREELRLRPIKDGFEFYIKMNSNTISNIKQELELDPSDNLTSINIGNDQLNIVLDNTIENQKFIIYSKAIQ